MEQPTNLLGDNNDQQATISSGKLEDKQQVTNFNELELE